MTYQSEELIRKETLIQIAKSMMIAARTAPKAKGIDNIVIGMVEEKEIEIISKTMKKIGEDLKGPAFIRDAANILQAPVMVLIGTKINPIGLKICGQCGFKNCDEKEKHPEIPCSFNTGDLGIAIGSAVSVAMNHRADNRVMYTVGQAITKIKLLGKDVKIAYGIPITSLSKNPFFDRT